MTLPTAIQIAADLLRAARRLVVLTGAGVSKESGVPTFRDALDGLWAQYDPMKLATATAFQRDPELVWGFYQHRRSLMQHIKPNAGHLALTALEKRFGAYPIITQNVDQLHEEAGSTNVIHLHGLIARNKCFNNCQGDPTPIDLESLADKDASPPKCPRCGAYVRPDVVWFGELLPQNGLQSAYDALKTCDLLLVVGTSGVVNPAASMPFVAKQNGAKVIEVNPNRSEITAVADVWIPAASGEALPRVLALLDEYEK